MSITASSARPAALALLVICAAGCAEPSGDVSISGHVSYRGESITHGTLTFFPSSGRPISAALSREGEYATQMSPGNYRITITVGVDLPVGWKEGDLVPPPQFVLPAQYTSRAKTSLAETVVENQRTPLDFTLE